MQKSTNNRLSVECPDCKKSFPLSNSNQLSCPFCKRSFDLSQDTFRHQLQLFTSLQEQILESAEILDETTIGISVGTEEIRIPYRLLLTRLGSQVKLQLGDQEVVVRYESQPSPNN